MLAGPITLADRSGMGNPREVMRRLGLPALAEDLGVATLVLDDLPADQWVMIQPPGSHWQRGFPIARPCHEAEALVQTCCLKTHRYGGHFTLSRSRTPSAWSARRSPATRTTTCASCTARRTSRR
jgi:uncharacterized protein (DUF362 family)